MEKRLISRAEKDQSVASEYGTPFYFDLIRWGIRASESLLKN